MATAGVPLWSTTATNNASADPAINWREGMAPSAVNDSARNEMASVAKWRNDLYGITTAGTSTAFTVTTGSTFAAAADMSGCVFTIIPHATSGAAPTLAVDGLTARAINESTGVAVATGALILGTPYLVKYVHASTEFILLGRSSVYKTLTATDNIIAAPGTTAGRPSAVSGGFRFNTDTALPEFSDGANWFSLITTLAGAQTPYGAVINGTITESHSANAVTFALKTLAGNDPSAGDPVLVAFRNSTAGTGNYVYKTVTAALSLVVSSGSTLGTTSNVAFKLWLVLFNDGGTVRMGAINTVSGSNIYPLGQTPLASSTAEGGLGAADTAQVFYTGTAVTSMPYAVLGYVYYGPSVISSAGAWAAAPTAIQLYGFGVPLPGDTIQTKYASTTSNTTNQTNAYVSTGVTVDIALTSAANLVRATSAGNLGGNGSTDNPTIAIHRGSTLIGIELRGVPPINSTWNFPASLFAIDAPGTTSSTTYVVKLHNHGTSNISSFPTTNGGNIYVEELMT